MDPITHAFIGVSIASMHGAPASLNNPVFLGTVLGAISPDFDFVMQSRGDMSYLRHHRGSSHSIPGMLVLSAGIAAFLKFIFPAFAWGEIFLWTLIGTLSHVFIDLFNLQGVKVLWPFNNKRYSCRALMAFDPILAVIIMIVFMLYRNPGACLKLTMTVILPAYITIRLLIMKWTKKIILNRLHYQYIIKDIYLLPTLYGPHTWDFILKTDQHFHLGNINLVFNQTRIKKSLLLEEHPLLEKALQSHMGQFFKEFSPYIHITYHKNDEGFVVKFLDLRYFLNNQFLYSATAIFNHRRELITATLTPIYRHRKSKLSA